MALNVTTAVIGSGCNTATASPSLAQWDRGQILQIEGAELPETYKVEFSNGKTLSAIPAIGTAAGVEIPDALLYDSSPITAYIVLTDESSRDTEYWVTIYVTPRQIPEDVQPDPEQSGVIDQLIAQLNSGVERAEAAASMLENVDAAATTLQPGSPATAEYSDGVFEFGIPEGEKGDPFTYEDFTEEEKAELVQGPILDAQTDAVAAVGTARVNAVNDVNAAGTTQVGNVNAAGDSQVQAVEDKGEEVIGSIPPDYSDLSAEVSDLNNAISDVGRNVTRYNAYNMIPINHENKTASGVAFTSNGDGSYSATGTAINNAIYYIYDNANVRPYGLEAGNTISVDFTNSGSGSVGFIQFYAYINGVIASSAFATLRNTGTYTITIPTNATGLRIQIRIQAGGTVTNTVFSLSAINAKTNKELEQDVASLMPSLSVIDKTINLFDYDAAEWTNYNATIQKLADGKTLRVTSTADGTNKHVYCILNVTGIDSIYVQSGTCICSVNSETTTPRIRIGKLDDDGTFVSWLGDTQFGKAIDVSSCNYIRVTLYAAYTSISLPSGTYVDYTNVMISSGDVKKPFVDAGWTAVDKLARSPYKIPDYYFAGDYLDNKIARINELCEGCMGNGDAFIFCTDQHWRLNAQNSPALIKYIFEHTNINRLFMGGDLCNGGSDLEFFAANKAYQNAFAGEIDYAVGNHEYLHSSLNDNNLSYWLYMRNDNRVYGDYSRHYYYIENDAQKIRYIVLSAYQYSGSSSSSVIGYEEAQQTWLQDVALGTLTAGWTAIIVTHLLYNVIAGSTQDTDSISLTGNCANIANIIAGYDGAGTIACVLQGHTHLDKITEVQSSGIPVLVTTCDKYAAGTTSGTDIPRVSRVHETITEQAFDVVIVDKTLKKITAVRIGAPALNGVGSAWGTEVQEREVTY